ncbi:anti-sigma B factor antagonist [Streptacidiphilus sp. MAP12-33]
MEIRSKASSWPGDKWLNAYAAVQRGLGPAIGMEARQGAGGSVDLSLSTRSVGDRTVVEVGGEIDVYTAPKLREQLVELVNEGHYHLIVDMEGVDFLDSTGLGVLVGGLKRVRAHEGSLRLVCNQERILKIFRITGLTKVFPIHGSVDEAVAAND